MRNVQPPRPAAAGSVAWARSGDRGIDVTPRDFGPLSGHGDAFADSRRRLFRTILRPRDPAQGFGTGIRHAARPGCLRHGPADPAGRLPDRRPAAPLAGRPAGGRAPAPTRRPVGAFGQRAPAQGARCRRPGLRCRSIWRLFCRHRHPAAGPPWPARRAGTPPTWPGTASPPAPRPGSTAHRQARARRPRRFLVPRAGASRPPNARWRRGTGRR
jgi:hypothetical protein